MNDEISKCCTVRSTMECSVTLATVQYSMANFPTICSCYLLYLHASLTDLIYCIRWEPSLDKLKRISSRSKSTFSCSLYRWCPWNNTTLYRHILQKYFVHKWIPPRTSVHIFTNSECVLNWVVQSKGLLQSLLLVFQFGSFPKHFVRFSAWSYYRTDRIFANYGREIHSQLADLLRVSQDDIQRSLPGGKIYRRHAGLWWSNSVQSSQDCPQCLQSSL